MKIAVYETTEDVPPKRRFLAQFEKIKNRLCIHFYGATAEEARQKAQDFWDKQVLPNARKKTDDEIAADAVDQDEEIRDPEKPSAAASIFGDLL